MRLKHKLLTFVFLVGLTFSLAIYAISKQVISSVVEELLWRYAQIAVRYDAKQALSPVEQEVLLTKELATHPHITSWAKNSNDEVYRSVAIDTLENYRWQFLSDNFFIALDENLTYHYNDVASIRHDSFLRYHLEPDASIDNWYFEQRDSGKALSVNIATDSRMDITKVWVNQSIYVDGLFAGILGTGVDMAILLDRITPHSADGVQTLLVDENMLVQLSFDSGELQSYPGYLSNNKPFLYEVIENSRDYDALSELMTKQKNSEEALRLLVEKGQGKAVVAIEYIESLQWFKITFVNVDAMVPTWVSGYLHLLLAFTSLSVTLVGYTLLKHHCVNPIESWSNRLHLLSRTKPNPHASMFTNLDRSMYLIERELSQKREELEDMVEKRTAVIDDLATLDAVTQLCNQNGFKRELKAELARAKREGYRFGMIWVDCGLGGKAKSNTDNHHYHQQLKFVAQGLKAATREYDVIGRWGDDEFVMLIRSDEIDVLEKISSRIQSYVDEQLEMKVVVGGVLVEPHMNTEQVLAASVSTIYTANSAGKRIYIHDSEPLKSQFA